MDHCRLQSLYWHQCKCLPTQQLTKLSDLLKESGDRTSAEWTKGSNIEERDKEVPLCVATVLCICKMSFICVIHDTVQTGSIQEFSLFIH